MPAAVRDAGRWVRGVALEKHEGGADPGTGDPEGPGQAHLVGGHHYAGEFHKGKLQGHGRYQWVDGVVYEGAHVASAPQGLGR